MIGAFSESYYGPYIVHRVFTLDYSRSYDRIYNFTQHN